MLKAITIIKSNMYYISNNKIISYITYKIYHIHIIIKYDIKKLVHSLGAGRITSALNSPFSWCVCGSTRKIALGCGMF